MYETTAFFGAPVVVVFARSLSRVYLSARVGPFTVGFLGGRRLFLSSRGLRSNVEYFKIGPGNSNHAARETLKRTV